MVLSGPFFFPIHAQLPIILLTKRVQVVQKLFPFAALLELDSFLIQLESCQCILNRIVNIRLHVTCEDAESEN